MNPDSPNKPFASYGRLFAMPAVVGVALLSTLIFIGISGMQMARTHVPLADAVMEMRYELAMFHLRFEEHLEYVQEHGSAKQVPVHIAWTHLAQSQWYAHALLFGGSNQEGVYVPLENPQLRQEIKQVLAALDTLRMVARQRLGEIAADSYDIAVERKFDAVFEHVLQTAGKAETTLQAAMMEEVTTFQRLLIMLSIMSVALMIAMGIARYRFESNRRSYEVRLMNSRDRINLLLNSAAEAIYGLDMHGRCTFANPACVRLLGYQSMDDVLDKNMHELIHHTRPDGSPYPMQECHIYKAFQKGEGSHIDDEVLCRRDGTSFAAEYWSYPIFEDEQITGCVVTFLDITERKVAEKRELFEKQRIEMSLTLNKMIDNDSREILDYVLEQCISRTGSSYSFIGLLNSDESVMHVHAWSRDVMEACAVEDREYVDFHLASGGLWGEPIRQRKAVIINDIAKSYPGKRTYPEGHVEIRRYLGVPIFEGERIVAMAGVANKKAEYSEYDSIRMNELMLDAWKLIQRKMAETEREKLIVELEEKNSEMERFVYTVSHDLKSPLITIQGFLGLLDKDADEGDEDRLRGDIRQIHKAADNMEALLADLLEISRIGRVSHPPEAVKLNELAEEVVDMLSLQLNKTGVRVNILPGLPVFYTDRKRMFEVMQNLIENALKFMGEQENPRIEIGVRKQDGEEIAYVSDNGIGIAPAYHDKVFGLFERLNRKADGTGIGLAIVKRIIDLNHGRIWVESEGEGRGATFCFVLPPQE